MKSSTKAFAVTNTIMGAAYLILFVMVGLKSGIVGIIIFLVMLGLHLGSGIGTLTGQDWGKMVSKILAWVGTILYSLTTLITIVAGARMMVRVLAFLPGFKGQAAGGFIAGLAVVIVMFLPFIMYYLAQLLMLKEEA